MSNQGSVTVPLCISGMIAGFEEVKKDRSQRHHERKLEMGWAVWLAFLRSFWWGTGNGMVGAE